MPDSEINVDTYRRLLEQLRDHLKAVEAWPSRLDEWVKELDVVDRGTLKDHLQRTRRSLAGMGSIGDLVICAEAGHRPASGGSTFEKANKRLLELVECLDEETTRRL